VEDIEVMARNKWQIKFMEERKVANLGSLGKWPLKWWWCEIIVCGSGLKLFFEIVFYHEKRSHCHSHLTSNSGCNILTSVHVVCIAMVCCV